MKNAWQILTILLAVALVVLSIKVMTTKESKTEDVVIDKGEIVYENIMTRSSVRSYSDKEIEKPIVEKLLRAGLAAPTAGNKQPWELIVVNDRFVLDSIAGIIPGAHMARKSNFAIVVLGTPSKALVPEYWVQDCSAVTENILLAAHGFGLGAVWCGAFPDNGSGKVAKMSNLLSLPEGTMALSVIVAGYPNSEPHVKDKWDAAKIHYDKY